MNNLNKKVQSTDNLLAAFENNFAVSQKMHNQIIGGRHLAVVPTEDDDTGSGGIGGGDTDGCTDPPFNF